MAVLEYRSAVCPECGTAEDEWIWRDDNGAVHRRVPDPYVAEADRCHGCAEIERARRMIPDDANTAGVRMRLRAVPGAWSPGL